MLSAYLLLVSGDGVTKSIHSISCSSLFTHRQGKLPKVQNSRGPLEFRYIIDTRYTTHSHLTEC